MGDQPVARSLPTHRKRLVQNECTQTSSLRVQFEPIVQVFEVFEVFERAKTVHVLDLSATVISI
jgi:hypothetical protein